MNINPFVKGLIKQFINTREVKVILNGQLIIDTGKETLNITQAEIDKFIKELES